jgi:chromosome segregation ATPase
MNPKTESTIKRLEEELETQRLANQELVCALQNQEADQLKIDQGRHRSLEFFQGLVKEQAAERRAAADLVTCLQEIGEWRAEMSVLRRAAEVLRANAISLAAHRNGVDQTNRFIKKLQDERNQLRAQLLEAESEIARLQILVSTPMSLEQREAEPAFTSPSPV